MMYHLVKKDKSSLFYYSYVTFGLEIKPSKKLEVNAKKLVLIDQSFIDEYVKIRINKKFDKLFIQIYKVLVSEDDTSSNETGMILDEIAKLKSIVINKYKNYISLKEYRNILKKLIIAQEEFEKEYNEKLYFERIIREMEEYKGKSM